MNALTTLERPISTPVAGWSPNALAAVGALRGVERGAIVTDDFGDTTQTVVLTELGAAVLTSWVPLAAVPGASRLIVRLTLPRIAHELALPLIRVRWFGPPVWAADAEILVHDVDTSHPAFGAPAPEDHQRFMAGSTSPALPYTIALHVALKGDDLLRAIAHEGRHAHQLWGDLDVPHEDRERDATAFAEAWMERPR